MGLENKALDVIKKEIGEWINDYLSSKEDNEDEDGDEGEGGGGGDVDGDISDDGIEDMVPTKKKAVAKKKPAASKAAEKKRKASLKSPKQYYSCGTSQNSKALSINSQSQLHCFFI